MSEEATALQDTETEKDELRSSRNPQSTQTYSPAPSPCNPAPWLHGCPCVPPQAKRRDGLGGFVKEKSTCCIERSLAQREQRDRPSLHPHLPSDLSNYRIQYQQVRELLSHQDQRSPRPGTHRHKTSTCTDSCVPVYLYVGIFIEASMDNKHLEQTKTYCRCKTGLIIHLHRKSDTHKGIMCTHTCTQNHFCYITSFFFNCSPSMQARGTEDGSDREGEDKGKRRVPEAKTSRFSRRLICQSLSFLFPKVNPLPSPSRYDPTSAGSCRMNRSG